ncbi:MAG TPA: histidine kinase [Pseudonocardia sp.]|uniref:sensor histidine kinase n=1 Tax=Pseudonocardia sp. TaxID=60912 RepID=UPI002C2135B2|nr:histidine kinase [Pseudonocardia sp.]HTF51349.1 histidine kinase [Pseudonocardia sp.]
MTVESTTSLMLGRLRRVRGHHDAVLRSLTLLAPVLLVMFLVNAFVAEPRPGLAGRPLGVTAAVLAFLVAVLGRALTTSARLRGAHIGFVALALASSTALTWLQPTGPGDAVLLVSVLFLAGLLPRPAVAPFMVVAFVTIETIAWLTGQGAPLTALAALYGLLFLAFRLNEVNKEAEQLLAELRRSQEAQARAANLSERQRLAREMHDVLAHSLSGLLLQLEGARMLAVDNPHDPRLPQIIERAHHLGRSGLAEARQAIGALRGDLLPGPERLAGLAEEFERDRAVPCRFTVSGHVHELGSEAQVALYRVAQEALTNIAKHAAPDRVELHLSYEPENTRLVVEDFASAVPAFPPTGRTGRASDTDGYGLAGMRERAELLGGRLATTTTGSGFRVELGLPT